MLMANRRGNDRRRKTGERSDFHDATRRENADQTGKKKIIARPNPARVTNVIEIHHGVEKFDFAGRRYFPGMPELFGELPILDLKLLPVPELTDIEAAAVDRKLFRRRAHHFPALPRGDGSPQIP